MKYVIHASIVNVGPDTYSVKARIEPTFHDASGAVVQETTCEPCGYAEARTACYKFVARLAYEIGKGGGEVVDVVITDAMGT